jgi:hypothetical protein
MLKQAKSHCSEILPNFSSHSVLYKENSTERRYTCDQEFFFWEITPRRLLKGVMSLKIEFFITTVVMTS